jgi:hypothetical protein
MIYFISIAFSLPCLYQFVSCIITRRVTTSSPHDCLLHNETTELYSTQAYFLTSRRIFSPYPHKRNSLPRGRLRYGYRAICRVLLANYADLQRLVTWYHLATLEVSREPCRWELRSSDATSVGYFPTFRRNLWTSSSGVYCSKEDTLFRSTDRGCGKFLLNGGNPFAGYGVS